MAPTPSAALPFAASLLSIVANLEGLDLEGLRRQWRAHLGGKAPAHLSRWLLMKVLAYRLQSDAFGDLDKSIRRILRSGKEDGGGAALSRPRFLLVKRARRPSAQMSKINDLRSGRRTEIAQKVAILGAPQGLYAKPRFRR